MELQMQYMSKLRRINLNIKNAYIDLKYNDQMLKLQQREELNELSYRGRVPRSVEEKKDKINADNKNANDKIKKLEMDKEDLKLDALKYYKGNLPAELSENWNKEESEHIDAINKILTEP